MLDSSPELPRKKWVSFGTFGADWLQSVRTVRVVQDISPNLPLLARSGSSSDVSRASAWSHMIM